MMGILILALALLCNAETPMKKYLTGDWKIYLVEDKMEAVEDSTSSGEETQATFTHTLIAAFNASERSDVPDILDVLRHNITEEEEEKYYQFSLTEDNQLEVTLIGDNEEDDKQIITLNFYNISNMFLAQGTFNDKEFTVFIPGVHSLLMNIEVYKNNGDNKVLIQRYIAEKAYVDERTFFQKYQMFIMMGIMMIFQMFMGQPQVPQQQQAQAAQ